MLFRWRTITFSPQELFLLKFWKDKIFLHFSLKDNYLVPVWKVWHKYFQHHILFFNVAIKFRLKKATVLTPPSKFLIYTWHFFGWRLIKMVRLTLETNTFCSSRIHVEMKSGFVCNNCRQTFPSNNFLQYLFLLI